ncbi:MAG: hypothetical protein ACR2KC_06830 [Acidimicrobiales bacterium]
MPRVVLAITILAAGLVLDATPARADNGCDAGSYQAAIDCGGVLMTTAPPVPAPAGAPAPAPPPMVTVAVVSSDPATGGYCINFVAVPASSATAGLTEKLALLAAGNMVDLYGNICPAAAVPPALAVNPAVLAVQFWRTIPLPVPHPSIPPGWAITGKPAYLVTGGVLNPAAWSENTPLGPLKITAHGYYQIDWGDPLQPGFTGPYAFEGAAYPAGTIVHTYDNVGTVTVRVREIWNATWTLGAAGGTLQSLGTQATIPGFVVRQVQAVIVG